MPFFLEKSLANEIHRSPFTDIIPFAAGSSLPQGKCLVCREGGGRYLAYPRLRPTALSGVNCTACVKPLRGLARWDCCHEVACGRMRCVPTNNAMMLRAGARPTVGAYGPVCGTYRRLDLLHTFRSSEKCEEKSRKGSLHTFHLWKV